MDYDADKKRRLNELGSLIEETEGVWLQRQETLDALESSEG